MKIQSDFANPVTTRSTFADARSVCLGVLMAAVVVFGVVSYNDFDETEDCNSARITAMLDAQVEDPSTVEEAQDSYDCS